MIVTCINNARQLQLFHIVKAGDALRPDLSLGQGRQKHGGKNRNDGDYNQQFNQRETAIGFGLVDCFFAASRHSQFFNAKVEAGATYYSRSRHVVG